MSKTIVFVLNKTLKAGHMVHLKGTKFSEDSLPAEFKPEVDGNTGTIGVFSYGEDFEGSSFDPEETITFKEPKKKLIGRPKKK
jgi:hypothetical protein